MARTTKLKPTEWLCVIAALVAALALYANIDALEWLKPSGAPQANQAADKNPLPTLSSIEQLGSFFSGTVEARGAVKTDVYKRAPWQTEVSRSGRKTMRYREIVRNGFQGDSASYTRYCLVELSDGSFVPARMHGWYARALRGGKAVALPPASKKPTTKAAKAALASVCQKYGASPDWELYFIDEATQKKQGQAAFFIKIALCAVVFIALGVLLLLLAGKIGLRKKARKDGRVRELSGFSAPYPSAGDTYPETSAEKWYVCAYAPWSAHFATDWRYTGGRTGLEDEGTERKGMTRENALLLLERDWGIKGQSDLLSTVMYLTLESEADDGEGNANMAAAETAAWDLCRALQILGNGFSVGFIDRGELLSESRKVGTLLQKLYGSWKGVYEGYLNGYRKWLSSDISEVSAEQAEEWLSLRRAIVEKLLALPDGPASVPFKTEL